MKLKIIILIFIYIQIIQTKIIKIPFKTYYNTTNINETKSIDMTEKLDKAKNLIEK